jgi:hypothetical protein
MSTIMIRDLAQSRDLDRRVMCAVRGGSLPVVSPPGIVVEPRINVVTNMNTDVVQFQEINVLNNAVIGTSFPFVLKVKQWARVPH